MAQKRQNEEALKRAQEYFDECRKHHDPFVEKLEERYKTYRGILDQVSDAAQWTTKSHPPYIMHIVETSLASLIEEKLKYRIRPKSSMASLLDPQASELARQGAKAHQIVFDEQIKLDKFSQIQRPYILQNAIGGFTVAKTYQITEKERRRRVVWTEEPLLDRYDMPIPGMSIPKAEEKTEMVTVYDGPTTEVRDIRDFFFPGNATSLKAAPYIIDRVWKLPEEIEEAYANGVFGPKRGGWSLQEVKEAISVSKDSAVEELVTREKELWDVDRTKGLVEVWEVWDNVHKTVTTVANRVALLSHREGFPFYHESYPFTVCSTQPDLFRIPGISQVEKIAHLQTLLWDITNQSTDNLRLINNAIAMFRPDVEDVDAYEFYPGARWMVEDPKQVEMWTPNPIPAEISLGREALIKGDMQNLAGGFPFSSGTDSQFVDQKTATGASIVSSLAQRSLDLHKQQLFASYEEIGQQRVILNQQFIREPFVASVIGLDGEEVPEEIWPQILAGDYAYELEPMPDAMMKQEEQASATALLQTIAPFVPIAQVAGTPLNVDAFIEDLLKAFGKEDFDRYFSKSRGMAPVPGGAGAGAPAQGDPTQSPMGVTGPGSIDPAVSPSSGVSMSPVAHLQRAQALDRS